MKKLLSFVLALLLIGGGFAFADVQIDEGQSLDTAGKVWFVGRYARTGDRAFACGVEISKDSAVILDTTSNDGVTIRCTTTSYDALVAGVTMDTIQDSSDDNTAAQDVNATYGNWGRVQTWGYHTGVRWQTHGGIYQFAAGQRVGTASTSGDSTVFRSASTDETATSADFQDASRDSYGVLMETPTAGDATADIFIKAM